MADKMMRIAGRDDAGLAKAIKVSDEGALESRFKTNSIIAKHVGVGIFNGTYGKTRASVIDVTQVTPADYRGHRYKSFFIKNNTNVNIKQIAVYGYVDAKNPATSVKLGETISTTSLLAGASKLFTEKDAGLEAINENDYEGIAITFIYSAGGTGTTDVYLLGSQTRDTSKVHDATSLAKLNELKQGSEAVKSEITTTNKKVDKLNDTMKAYPRKGLEIVRRLNLGVEYAAQSVGFDGNVYGRTTNNTLFRSKDGMRTFEIGQKMSDLAGWTGASSVYQTYAGYVVVEIKSATQTGSIWFSENFDSGFAKVMDFDDGFPAELAKSVYNGDRHRSVLLFGEYSTNMVQVGRERKVYGSFDGGRTFSTIFTSQPVTYSGIAGENCHIHATLFDPYENRIWVSHGDGPNAKLFYSDNYGVSWKLVDAVFEGVHQQPTVMMALPERVAMLPDTQLPPSVVSFPKDRKYTLPLQETFTIQHDYSLLPNVGNVGAGAFSISPYAQDGNMVYFTVPGDAAGTRPLVIVGTGDGGRSWHNLFSMRGALARSGIIGPDKHGYLYLPYTADNKSNTNVFKQPDWGHPKEQKIEVKNKVLIEHFKLSVSNRLIGENLQTFVDDTSLNLVTPLDYSEFRRKSILIVNNTSLSINRVAIYGTYGTKPGSPRVLIKDYVVTDMIPVGGQKLFSGDDPDLKLLDNGIIGLFVKVTFSAGGTGTYDVHFIGGQ